MDLELKKSKTLSICKDKHYLEEMENEQKCLHQSKTREFLEEQIINNKVKNGINEKSSSQNLVSKVYKEEGETKRKTITESDKSRFLIQNYLESVKRIKSFKINNFLIKWESSEAEDEQKDKTNTHTKAKKKWRMLLNLVKAVNCMKTFEIKEIKSIRDIDSYLKDNNLDKKHRCNTSLRK